MAEMSHSFVMGYGSIEHNLRTLKGNGLRQNGVPERHSFNEYLVTDVDPKKVIAEKVQEKLNELNEHHILKRHPERVRTIDDWIKKECYTRQDKPRRYIHEIVVQCGDKFTACPYEVQKDKDGFMIDINGKRIKSYDTRKRPAYKDGKVTESRISKKLKKVYRDFLKRFIKENPQLTVVAAAIHGDEFGGLHLHINYIAFNHKKTDTGIGLSYTKAIAQQYEAKGIKIKDNGRKDNPTTHWRTDMRILLKKTALDYGIDRINMGNTEKHKDTYNFGKWKDGQVEMMEEEVKIRTLEELKRIENLEKQLKEREQALNDKKVPTEWYILKKKYPEVYKKVHTEYVNNYKNVNKGIDRVDGNSL